MIANLADWAETELQSRCDRAGVLRQKPSQDRSGWDFILEFPAETKPGAPADRQPIERSAKVQVKSKRSGKPVATINLLNARRFALDGLPCFIVQFVATDGADPVRVYARHFSDDLIRTTLRRVREADSKGRLDLHQLVLSVPFSDEDEHTHNLIEWIAEEVGSDGADYARKKQEFAARVGYGESSIEGTVTFAVSELDTLREHSIGLLPSFQPEHVVIVDKRFGIPAAQPVFEGRPAFMQLTVHPEPARIRLTNRLGNSMWIEGQMHVAPDFGFVESGFRARFSSEVCSIDFKPHGSATMRVYFDRAERKKLSTLRQCIDAALCIEMGVVDGQLKFRSLPLDFTIDAKHNYRDPWKENAATALQCIANIHAFSQKSEPALSLDDISSGWEQLDAFNGYANGPSAGLRLTLAKGVSAETLVNRFLGFCYVRLGDWTFYAVVERSVEGSSLAGDTKEFRLGRAKILDAMMTNKDTQKYHRQIRQSFKRRLAQARCTVFFGNGDLNKIPNGVTNVTYSGPEASICA